MLQEETLTEDQLTSAASHTEEQMVEPEPTIEQECLGILHVQAYQKQ